MSSLSLIVGLGNPGPEYKSTRHNAGVWWVKALAECYGCQWQLENKFHGFCARIKTHHMDCRLLLPVTYMNRSGMAVSSVAKYYQCDSGKILIAHDEIDLKAGQVRLKKSGGHGGHNGLRDIISALGDRDFWRLRIGVGHPGHKSQVIDYVLKSPSKKEQLVIDQSIDDSLGMKEELLGGEMAKAMNIINTKNESA